MSATIEQMNDLFEHRRTWIEPYADMYVVKFAASPNNMYGLNAKSMKAAIKEAQELELNGVFEEFQR